MLFITHCFSMNIKIAQETLKQYFGFDSFRPMQAEIIETVYAGQDALVLMPTGGGKSICFQIPAMTMPGTCIVVSPLISLMKDQVEGLKANGVLAAYYNSSLNSGEQRAIEDALIEERLQLLYISPEKLLSPSFQPVLAKAKINLFAIDEAHCVSTWGHDFRPEYTRMGFLKRQFKNTPIMALTATADKVTRKDIAEQLGLGTPKTFLASFDRPNLSLTVRPGRKRIEQIIEFVSNRKGQSGIIYCLSKKSTEALSEKLKNKGIKADFYHAGRSHQDRARVQEAFINDDVEIVCATIAFGMGIDKSNVRWVIHYNLPKNIEGYYQQIGRAGRDGVRSDTLLFYSFADVMSMRSMLGDSLSSERLEVQLAKLERMQQYAEALICRRRILLSYFNEHLTEQCGNCDVCQNPPKEFDGTVIAQKALSAIYRLREKVGVNTLIDVLRGSKRRDIFEKGYHNIKTYGAGANHGFADWQQFLLQLINKGYVEIAYDQNHQLKLTELSRGVLFDGEKVPLVLMNEIKQQREERMKKKSKSELIRDSLMERLKELRRRIAQTRGVPPYLIFSDATLEEMAKNKPTDDAALAGISGVGQRKLHLYGAQFLEEIRQFIIEKSEAGERIKGSTYIVTQHYLRQGMNVDAIAEKRGINPVTVYSHIATLYERGADVDLMDYIDERDLNAVKEAQKALGDEIAPKEIFEFHKEQMPYHKIRLSMTYLKMN